MLLMIHEKPEVSDGFSAFHLSRTTNYYSVSRFFLHTNSSFRHAISSSLVVRFLTIPYFLVSWAVNVQIKAKIKNNLNRLKTYLKGQLAYFNVTSNPPYKF